MFICIEIYTHMDCVVGLLLLFITQKMGFPKGVYDIIRDTKKRGTRVSQDLFLTTSNTVMSDQTKRT